MNKLVAISRNAFLQTVRQPIYAIIVLVTLGGYFMAPSLTGWTLDDDNMLLRDIGLSTLLMQGLFLAGFCASAILSQEIEQRTVLMTVSKPLPRAIFVFGKAFGLFAAMILAHIIGTIAYVMCMRHGVLQTSADTSDPTVLVLGPGVVALMLILAGIANYALDWKFLPTAICLIAPALVVSITILSFIDRNWKVSSYKTSQEYVKLPMEIASTTELHDIVEFVPQQGEKAVPGAIGHLVRSNWKGPITDQERDYLRGLSQDYQWLQRLDWLVAESRKITTPDMMKAAYCILLAVLMLAAIALCASTRLGTVPTLVVCIVLLAAGLMTDHFLQPLDAQGVWWAKILYRILPNFQMFWLIDALADNRVIPWHYLLQTTGYAAAYLLGTLLFSSALFETREVG